MRSFDDHVGTKTEIERGMDFEPKKWLSPCRSSIIDLSSEKS